MANETETRNRFSRKGLTAAVLRDLVKYVPETGEFLRLKAPMRAAGKLLNRPAAPYLHSNGYSVISLVRKWRFRAHQLAWLYQNGEWPAADVDHINGVRTDNRWSNLRAATRSQNLGNARTPSTNTSGLKGASWNKGKWLAQIVKNGRLHFLGRFDTKEEAHAAYMAAAQRLHGEFARAG